MMIFPLFPLHVYFSFFHFISFLFLPASKQTLQKCVFISLLFPLLYNFPFPPLSETKHNVNLQMKFDFNKKLYQLKNIKFCCNLQVSEFKTPKPNKSKFKNGNTIKQLLQNKNKNTPRKSECLSRYRYSYKGNTRKCAILRPQNWNTNFSRSRELRDQTTTSAEP